MILTTPQLSGRVFTVMIAGNTIATSGSPVDRLSAAIPAGVTRWTPTRCIIRAATASATLAAASVGVFTQAAAAGTTIVTAAAISSLSAANKLQTMTVAAQTDGITDLNIFVRQTVNSGNAGTIDVVVECLDLS